MRVAKDTQFRCATLPLPVSRFPWALLILVDPPFPASSSLLRMLHLHCQSCIMGTVAGATQHNKRAQIVHGGSIGALADCSAPGFTGWRLFVRGGAPSVCERRSTLTIVNVYNYWQSQPNFLSAGVAGAGRKPKPSARRHHCLHQRRFHAQMLASAGAARLLVHPAHARTKLDCCPRRLPAQLLPPRRKETPEERVGQRKRKMRRRQVERASASPRASQFPCSWPPHAPPQR